MQVYPPFPESSHSRAAGHRRDIDRLQRRTAGPWNYVGGVVPSDDVNGVAGADFISGSNATPTSTVPNPVPLRYRWTLGAGLEIQGDVTGLSSGDTVFVLPAGYRLERDVPVSTHDDLGNYVACRLLSTGEFLYGVA